MILPRGIELLTARADLLNYIPLVILAADTERESFGFLPARAYEDFALQKRLIVARPEGQTILAGYIAFGGTGSQARIFQTYVAPKFRRLGLAKSLVDEVIRRAEEDALLSIRVEVASDLSSANEFYKNCGFRKVREKTGGASRNRKIWTRVRELNSPSLLDVASYGPVGGAPISLTLSTAKTSPLYLVDLNVMFDVTKRRGNAFGAGRVFAAALDNAVQLAVANEFVIELERNMIPGKPDPILELARTLPRLKKPDGTKLSNLRNQIAPLLFPERWISGSLNERDESDIVHLATAIVESAHGFITSEKAILRCGDWFRSSHKLEIISPDVFGKRFTANTRVSDAYQVKLGSQSVEVRELKDKELDGAQEFLRSQEVPDHVVKSALAMGNSVCPRRRMVVRSADRIVAISSWTPPRGHDRVVRLYLFVDEGEGALGAAVDHIAEVAARDAAAHEPAVLQVVPPPDQVRLRNRLVELGFRPHSEQKIRTGTLDKICIGSVVSDLNWSIIRDQFKTLVGIELPDEPPIFREPSDQIVLRSISGQTASIGLGDLENSISPAIFALRGRPGAIVPIRPAYAEALFRGSTQPSFLNEQQAALMRQKRYFGDARTYGTMSDHGLIFFYESNHKGEGRSSVTAVARVVRRYLAQEESATKLSREKGVLSASQLAGMARGNAVCVTEFDNLMMFQKPVPLAVLKEIGCADDANMVTARNLAPEAMLALIERGQPACVR